MRSPYLLKVLLLLLGLVLLVELSSYATTRVVVRDAVIDGARSELQRGGAVFAQLMRARAEQLTLSARILTDDFGFKDVVAGGDAASIRSALDNHAARIQADIAVVADTLGRPIASTRALAPESWSFLVEYAQQPNFNSAHGTKMIGGRPYQFVLAQMRAPLPIGLVGMGFEVNDQLTQELKRLTELDISFINLTEEGGHYLSGTLKGQARLELLNRLQNRAPEPGTVITTEQSMLLLAPVAQDLVAVLQLPLAQALAPFSQLNQRLLWVAVGFSLLATILAVFIARGVTQPVSTLARVVRRVASGHYDTMVPVQTQDELGELARGVSQMQTAIAEREQHIRYQGSHDRLTGLINRGELFRALESAIQKSNKTGTGFALLVVDIDNFTRINDALGHETGDQVLVEVARLLQRELGEGQVVARLGSDEFAMLLNDERGPAHAFAQCLLDCLMSDLNIKGGYLGMDLNIGLAHYPEHGEDPEVLLRRANLALNRARSEQQRIMDYQSGWDENHLRRLRLFGDFAQALESDQISVHYQPKLGLDGSASLGGEALIRWHHPELGDVNPEEFVAVVESSGQIGQLTRWVLRAASAQLAQWPEAVTLSVNLSALDLMDSQLPDYVARLLQEFNLTPSRIWLEVTESAVMQEAELSIVTMGRLKALGVNLSIDDFGTGYSSLSQLKKLPVSELKIDKAFVLNLDQSEDDQLIVRSTINLAHTMGLSVTAEGIENQAAEALLIEYGCERGQGYYYSKPLPADAFEQWLHHHLRPNGKAVNP